MIVYTLRDSSHEPIQGFRDFANARRALEETFLAHHLHTNGADSPRLELFVTADIYPGDVGDILLCRIDGGQTAASEQFG